MPGVDQQREFRATEFDSPPLCVDATHPEIVIIAARGTVLDRAAVAQLVPFLLFWLAGATTGTPRDDEPESVTGEIANALQILMTFFDRGPDEVLGVRTVLEGHCFVIERADLNTVVRRLSRALMQLTMANVDARTAAAAALNGLLPHPGTEDVDGPAHE